MAVAPTYLPVAVRAFIERAGATDPAIDPEAEGSERTSSRERRIALPEAILVFDAESTVDATQRLNFGAWRFVRADWTASGEPVLSCVEKGLFYADDLPDRYPRGYRTLETYANHHRPDIDRAQWDFAWRLRFVSVREFTEDVLPVPSGAQGPVLGRRVQPQFRPLAPRG